MEDEHLDETLPREARAAALAMKPGDVECVPSSLGVHVLRVDDVFQTLNIDSQPRTRGLPGTGHRPTPLIELLRQGSPAGSSSCSGQVPPLAVPQLGSCASSGRA